MPSGFLSSCRVYSRSTREDFWSSLEVSTTTSSAATSMCPIVSSFSTGFLATSPDRWPLVLDAVPGVGASSSSRSISYWAFLMFCFTIISSNYQRNNSKPYLKFLAHLCSLGLLVILPVDYLHGQRFDQAWNV